MGGGGGIKYNEKIDSRQSFDPILVISCETVGEEEFMAVPRFLAWKIGYIP